MRQLAWFLQKNQCQNIHTYIQRKRIKIALIEDILGVNGEIQIGTAHNRKIPMLNFLDVIIQYDYIGDLVLGGT